MSALGSLVVKLALEYAQFSKGLDDSEQDVKKHAKSVQDSYDRMASGIENRVTSLRNTVVGALAGAISVAGLVSAIGKVRAETIAAEQEQQQLAAALQSTGQAAGWSQEKLNAMADSLAKSSNFSAGELNQAQARLLSYTGIVGQTFPRAMQAVADMSARMGTSVTASAESIGRALDIPSAGLTALTQQGFRFTDSQKNMVQQLERTGRVAEAQAIILQALEGSYGGAAAAARDSLGGALTAVGETINGLLTADSASVPELRDSIEGLNDTLSSEAVRSAVQSLVGGIADLGSFAATTAAQVISLGTAVAEHSDTIFMLFSVIAGAGTALGIAKVVGSIALIPGAITKVTAAWAALNVVMAANPAALALMGLGAAVGGAYALSQNTEMQSRALDRAAEQHLKNLQAQKKQLQEYVSLDPSNQRDASELARVNQEIDSITTSKLAAMADAAAATAAEVKDAFGEIEVAAQSLNGSIGLSDEWIRRFGSTTQKAALEVAEWKRKLGDGFTPAMQAEVEAYWAKQDAGAKNGAQSAKQLAQAYSNLKDSIAEKASALQQELRSGEKLTEAEKLRIKYTQDLKGSLSGLSTAKRESIAGDINALAVLEKEVEARKALAQAIEDERKHRQDWWALQAKTVEELQAGNAQLRDEIALIGLTEQEQARVNAQRQETILLLLEQQLVQMAQAEDAVGFMSRQRIALEQEIEARRELLGLLGQKTAREANAKAAKDAASDWEKTSQTIGQTLSDYIMAGGKSGADYVERLFRNLVLQPVVQYGGNSLMGALGMGQQGSAVNSVLGGNNVGTTVLNNAGAIGAGFQAMYGMSVGASSASLLGANAVGMVGGDALGALAAANGMWAGVATGAQAAAQSAIAANVAMEAGTAAALEAGTLAAAQGAATGAAAGASSIMSGIATAAPWIAGALALYSIAKSFDNSGTLHYGAESVYSNGEVKRGSFPTKQWSASAQENVNSIAGALGSAMDGMAKSFGEEAGYTLRTYFADDSSKDGAWGDLYIADALGNVLVNWEASRQSKWAPKTFSDGDEGYKQYLAAVAVDVKSAFLAMDIPAWSKQLLDAATDIDTLSAALAQVGATKAAFDALGKTMSMFSDLSGDMQTALINSSGGMDALAQNASSYYQAYYSEQERYEASLKQMRDVLAGLNLSIDPAAGEKAKADFRAAVDNAFASGSGELGAQLLGINQQFLALADYAQKAGVVVEDVAQVLSDVMRDLLDDRKSLEAELLRAQGDQSGYLAAVRAIATAGYAEAEIAAWDYNTALQAQIEALDAASAAAQQSAQEELQRIAAVSSERMGLERQLLQMQGDTAAIRALERSALDETNRALYDRINALQDESAAVAAAAQRLAAITSERAGLERQLLQEQGNTAALRALERAALDETNRALYDHIAALQDAQTAAQASAQAAGQAFSSAWSNLGSMSAMAAQYLGNGAGLEAQLAAMQQSFAGADNTTDRVTALQEIVGLEQSLWNLQQRERQAEAKAAQAQITASQEQLSSAQKLLTAARSLGDYAQSLFAGSASGLAGSDRMDALNAQYQVLLMRAKAGDADAVGGLQTVSRDYLQLAQQRSGSSAEYSVMAGRVAAEMQSVAAVQSASASSITSSLESQIGALQAQASQLSGAQFDVSEQTRGLMEELLQESAVGFKDSLRGMEALADLTEEQLTALKQWPAALNGIMSATLVPSIQGIAASASSSAVSAYIAANAAAEEQRLRRAAELAADQMRQQMAAMTAAAEAVKQASIVSASAGVVHGSHADGLAYVPFDNYRANLHKGERVLTEAENRMYSMPVQTLQVQSQSTQQLERKVERLEVQMARMANATEQLLDITDQVSAGGMSNATQITNVKVLAQAIAEAVREAVA